MPTRTFTHHISVNATPGEFLQVLWYTTFVSTELHRPYPKGTQ
jgi:hypothetical protein